MLWGDVYQPIMYAADPRFSHCPWAHFRARVPDTYPECFTADGLRSIVADLMQYIRPQYQGSSDALVQDITAQLEASLSLL